MRRRGGGASERTAVVVDGLGQPGLRLEEPAEIVVRDTGIGIPEAAQPRVFDRFYRVDKARTRTMGGAGLGLSIAQWIVEVHGGEINLASKPGEGSTFTVVLPVATPNS